MEKIKAKCARCSGTGQVAHRTARLDTTCFCCGGKGFIMRKRPTKHMTEAEKLARYNQRIRDGLNPNTGEPLVLPVCLSN